VIAVTVARCVTSCAPPASGGSVWPVLIFFAVVTWVALQFRASRRDVWSRRVGRHADLILYLAADAAATARLVAAPALRLWRFKGAREAARRESEKIEEEFKRLFRWRDE
jgi:hypothetical protein